MQIICKCEILKSKAALTAPIAKQDRKYKWSEKTERMLSREKAESGVTSQTQRKQDDKAKPRKGHRDNGKKHHLLQALMSKVMGRANTSTVVFHHKMVNLPKCHSSSEFMEEERLHELEATSRDVGSNMQCVVNFDGTTTTTTNYVPCHDNISLLDLYKNQ
ncbi:hypothetical protein STEG23_019528, partial [Scotinomys teguina]